MSEAIVTRGSQITLTKEIREKLEVKEGDVIIMNVMDSILVASKRDPKIWNKVGDFLPDNFEKILEKIRKTPEERLKRLGITR